MLLLWIVTLFEMLNFPGNPAKQFPKDVRIVGIRLDEHLVIGITPDTLVDVVAEIPGQNASKAIVKRVKVLENECRRPNQEDPSKVVVTLAMNGTQASELSRRLDDNPRPRLRLRVIKDGPK